MTAKKRRARRIVGYVVLWEGIVMQAARHYGLVNPDVEAATLFGTRHAATLAIGKSARYWKDAIQHYRIVAVRR